jgi:catechol 2,3-dioxygenase-like lactoylglutathione lyase family enzyme
VTFPARLTVVTLGARDADSLAAFYRALGWHEAVDADGFHAFATGGVVFTLWPLELLAEAARLEPLEQGFRGMNLALNVDERGQVDEAVEAARAAGARITREPADEEWGGRSAYFTDPEENLWEVAWVPPENEMAELVRRATS